MTKEKLKNYRNLKLELEDLEIKIHTLKVQDSVSGTSKYPPHIMQTHRIEGTAPENYSLLEHKAELKAQIREIEDFVNNINDFVVRDALNLKYIRIEEDRNGKKKPAPKWFQIAQKIDCGLSGDAIRMKAKRFLKNY